VSRQLIDHSTDLKRLQTEGYEIRIKEGFLLISSVPYLDKNGQLRQGVLASELTQQGSAAAPPSAHPIWWQGEYPCRRDGTPISGLYNPTAGKELCKGFTADHYFSAKPSYPGTPGTGYANYYDKAVTYIGIISAPAMSLYPKATAQTERVFPDEEDDSPFLYPDTNSSRAEINIISDKLRGQKIAIVGLGGTGSYILDFVAKTLVSEIHLFDDDVFGQHNAFRAPGAASLADLDAKIKKVDYYYGIYSQIRTGIFPHDVRLSWETLGNLVGFSFVFVAMDKGALKKKLFEFLVAKGTPFIDVGMGILRIGDALRGTIRVTTGTPTMHEHLVKRVSMKDNEEEDAYKSNIQIAEANALNAALAVIRWKRLFGFYIDQENEHHTQFSLDELNVFNADYTPSIC
jgi:hypothetical protein